MNTFAWKRYLGLTALVVAAGVPAEGAWAYTAPYSTPPGITLVDVSKLMDEGSPQYLWRRLGDTSGNPLYTYDADQAGRSSCYGDCAKEFLAYLADAHAKGFGDWSILQRDDHSRQWVYQGKPLYRYSGKDPIGEPQGARFQLIESPSWHDPSSSVYAPKKGWRRAAYTPEHTLAMPTSVELEFLGMAGGFGFVEAATHLTVYAAPPSHKLSQDWQPVRAAALAVPLGDFSIVKRRDDGTRQWAYRGEALYTYAGDYAAGYVNGIFSGDRAVQAALVYRNFMPDGISIGNYLGRGPLMTSAKGQTLYFIARYHATYGGREAPGAYSVSYNELKSQGTLACQGDCTVTWKPILAGANAQASGFWELMDRPEGKQWAYKGTPIYTFIGDRKAGDVEGNNRNVIVFGGPKGEIVYADAGADPRDPAPRLGKLDMVTAVGAKPGERGLYIAGEGYTGAQAAKDFTAIPGQGRGQGQARAPGQARGQGAAAQDRGAQGQDQGQGQGGFRRGPGDHGAGFYWHTISLF
jgi:predicted lipoprotein with Yx(FWY)xxD motif